MYTRRNEYSSFHGTSEDSVFIIAISAIMTFDPFYPSVLRKYTVMGVRKEEQETNAYHLK